MGLVFTSIRVYAQKNNYSDDLQIYQQANKIDHYPESIRNLGDSALVFCQIFFTKGAENDSIVVYNTSNEEIKELVTQCVKKIKFKKRYRKESSIVFTYIFKNGDEFKNYNIPVCVTQLNFLWIYGNPTKPEAYSVRFIRPIIEVGYKDGPPIR